MSLDHQGVNLELHIRTHDVYSTLVLFTFFGKLWRRQSQLGRIRRPHTPYDFYD